MLVVLLVLASLAITLLNQAPVQPARTPAPVEDGTVSLRIIFGQQQMTERNYDGSLAVFQGSVVRLTPFRFFRDDALVGSDSWRLTLKRVPFESRSGRPNSLASGGPAQNVVPAGITATLASTTDTTRVTVRTTQGNFEFSLRDLGARALDFLDGDVSVERVPSVIKMNDPGTEEQNDYPSFLESRRGEKWVAWQAYKDGGDHIYVRRASKAGWSPVERLTDEKGDLLRTALAEDTAGAIHLVWSERRGEDWNLVERRFDGKTWSAKSGITSGAGTNIHHRLASDAQGNLHLVWVGHKGGKSFVAHARFSSSGWSQPQDVSGPGAWSPDLGVDRSGNVYVAWDSYRSGNYDIYLRRIAAGGELGPIEQVTKSPRFQAHPSVALDNLDRPWLAWDETGTNWGKDWTHENQNRSTVLYTDRKVVLAVQDGGEWKQPRADPNASVPAYLRRYVHLPRIRFDAGGRLWLMVQSRTFVGNNREDYWAANARWDAFVTSLNGDSWRPAIMLPESTCRLEGPFDLVPAASGGMNLFWATDNRPFTGTGGFAAATAGQYEVYSSHSREDTVPREPLFDKFSEPLGVPVLAHPDENGAVGRVRNYRVRAEGRELRILRGDFHRHTDISNDGAGDGSVEDYFRYMIDAAQMDTGIIGDHNMGGDIEYNWWRTEKACDTYHIREGYVPLFGYERSVAYPNGHRNIVFDHRGVRTLPVSPEENQGKINSGPVLYPYLRQNRGICMEHSLATGQGTDWRDNDPELEPLVELYQGYHANYEYEGAPLAETPNYLVSIHGAYRPAGFFWNALAKGLKLGVQASSDHISTHTSYAMILTPSSRRADIVQSMRERHAYAATDNIILDFQALDGDRTHIMGDIFETRTRKVQFKIRIVGTDTITWMDIIKNNTIAFTRQGDSSEMTVDYADTSPRPGENYYYVRVQQIDRNLAWSSPIWVKY
jgi:hypothetical protein